MANLSQAIESLQKQIEELKGTLTAARKFCGVSRCLFPRFACHTSQFWKPICCLDPGRRCSSSCLTHNQPNRAKESSRQRVEERP